MRQIASLDPRAVGIDEQLVLRLMGYPAGSPVSPAVTEALPRVIRAVVDLAEPQTLYQLQEVRSTTRETVQLAGDLTFSGHRLALALRHAPQAALYVLTLGQPVSTAVRELAAEDPFESFVTDSVASILVETIADQFQAQLEEHMQKLGAWGGHPFSPGYCDWPTRENRPLLEALDAKSIGVRLTAGGMMTPPKSISGVIPFGPDPKKIQVNPCATCPRTDCDHRRSHAP